MTNGKETRYGMIRDNLYNLKYPQKNLLRVPHKQGDLIVAYPAFGKNCLSNNMIEMQKKYSHPKTKKIITFRGPTITESISAATYNFNDEIKSRFLDAGDFFQLGKAVRTTRGVFVNPPKNNSGNFILDEKVLDSCLNECINSNGIWLYEGNNPQLKDFGFAPDETFNSNPNSRYEMEEDSLYFSNGGLARVLEHTFEHAKNIQQIAQSYPDYYGHGIIKKVELHGFDKIGGRSLIFFKCSEEPILGTVGFINLYDTPMGFREEKLRITGLGICLAENKTAGYTFGVLDEETKRSKQ